MSAVDPKNIPDSWIDNGNGTYTAQAGATLYGLYGSDWETKSGYEGDPTKLQIGQTVGTSNTPNIPTFPSWQELQAGLPENQETIESDNGTYGRAANIGIGVGEILSGVVIITLGCVSTAALAPESAGASAMIGYQSIITGSTTIALGITRVAGANNQPFIEDVKIILIPPMAAFGTENHR